MKTIAPPPDIALRPYLRDGEELLWSGRPYASVPYHPHWIKIASAFFFGAAALSWEVTAIKDLFIALEEDPEFALFEVVFALMGLVAIVVVFPQLWILLIGSRGQLQRTVYGVTNSRVLILYPHKKSMTLQEYVPKNLPSVNLQQEKDGTGTIIFAIDETDGEDGELGKAFYHIDDARHVYEFVSELR